MKSNGSVYILLILGSSNPSRIGERKTKKSRDTLLQHWLRGVWRETRILASASWPLPQLSGQWTLASNSMDLLHQWTSSSLNWKKGLFCVCVFIFVKSRIWKQRLNGEEFFEHQRGGWTESGDDEKAGWTAIVLEIGSFPKEKKHFTKKLIPVAKLWITICDPTIEFECKWMNRLLVSNHNRFESIVGVCLQQSIWHAARL